MTSPNNCPIRRDWYDTCGKQRREEEPEARTFIRQMYQVAPKDVDKNYYLNMLREFDRSWA